MSAVSLRSLRERPFELLVELERRARVAAAGQMRGAGTADEWVGVGFKLGADRFVAARSEIKEVLNCPPTTRVPGAKDWVKGIANVRGDLLPIFDLNAFARRATSSARRGSRVLVVNHPEIPAGLMVDQVVGFRRFTVGDQVEQVSQSGGLDEYLTGAYERDGESWPVINLRQLLESEQFGQAAE